MPQTVTLKMNLEITREQFRDLACDRKSNIQQLVIGIEPELRDFDRYLESQKMDPMGNIERSILREYIGWKLVSNG